MGNNDELESLLKQKADLDTRTDITPEQRTKLARTLRRKIRQLGGSCRVLGSPTKSETGEKTPRTRSSRFIKKVRPAQQLAYQEYCKKITENLSTLGLEKKSKESIMGVSTYGYSIPACHIENVTAEELIEKFKHRWSSHSPLWYYTDDKETREFILLGPVPFKNDHPTKLLK